MDYAGNISNVNRGTKNIFKIFRYLVLIFAFFVCVCINNEMKIFAAPFSKSAEAKLSSNPSIGYNVNDNRKINEIAVSKDFWQAKFYFCKSEANVGFTIYDEYYTNHVSLNAKAECDLIFNIIYTSSNYDSYSTLNWSSIVSGKTSSDIDGAFSKVNENISVQISGSPNGFFYDERVRYKTSSVADIGVNWTGIQLNFDNFEKKHEYPQDSNGVTSVYACVAYATEIAVGKPAGEYNCAWLYFMDFIPPVATGKTTCTSGYGIYNYIGGNYSCTFPINITDPSGVHVDSRVENAYIYYLESNKSVETYCNTTIGVGDFDTNITVSCRAGFSGSIMVTGTVFVKDLLGNAATLSFESYKIHCDYLAPEVSEIYIDSQEEWRKNREIYVKYREISSDNGGYVQTGIKSFDEDSVEFCWMKEEVDQKKCVSSNLISEIQVNVINQANFPLEEMYALLDGNYRLFVKVCDKIGNCSETEIGSANFDNTAPVITANGNGVYNGWNKNGTEYDENGWISSEVKYANDVEKGYIVGKVADNHFDIEKVYFKWRDDSDYTKIAKYDESNVNKETKSFIIPIPSDESLTGIKYLCYYAQDGAFSHEGTVNVTSYACDSFAIDNVNPDIKEFNHSSPTGVISQSHTIQTVVYDDSGSLMLDSEKGTLNAYYRWCTENTFNSSGCAINDTIFNIRRPNGAVEGNDGKTYTFENKLSNIGGSGNVTIESDGDYVFCVLVRDAAGNSTNSCHPQVLTLDNTKVAADKVFLDVDVFEKNNIEHLGGVDEYEKVTENGNTSTFRVFSKAFNSEYVVKAYVAIQDSHIKLINSQEYIETSADMVKLYKNGVYGNDYSRYLNEKSCSYRIDVVKDEEGDGKTGTLTLFITGCTYSIPDGLMTKNDYLLLNVVFPASYYTDLADNPLTNDVKFSIRIDNDISSDNLEVCQYRGTIGCVNDSERLYLTDEYMYVQLHFTQGYAEKGNSYENLSKYDGLNIELIQEGKTFSDILKFTKVSHYNNKKIETKSSISNDVLKNYEVILVYRIKVTAEMYGGNKEWKIVINYDEEVTNKLVELGGVPIEFSNSTYELNNIVLNMPDPIVNKITYNGYTDENYEIQFNYLGSEGEGHENIFYYSNSLYLEVLVDITVYYAYLETDDLIGKIDYTKLVMGDLDSEIGSNAEVYATLTCAYGLDGKEEGCEKYENKYTVIFRFGNSLYQKGNYEKTPKIMEGFIAISIGHATLTNKVEFNGPKIDYNCEEVDLFENNFNDDGSLNVYKESLIKLKYDEKLSYYQMTDDLKYENINNNLCKVVILGDNESCIKALYDVDVDGKDDSVLKIKSSDEIKLKSDVRNKYGVEFTYKEVIELHDLIAEIQANVDTNDSIDDEIFDDIENIKYTDDGPVLSFSHYVEKMDLDDLVKEVELTISLNFADDVIGEFVWDNSNYECVYRENNVCTATIKEKLENTYQYQTYNYEVREKNTGTLVVILINLYVYDSSNISFELEDLKYDEYFRKCNSIDNDCIVLKSTNSDEIKFDDGLFDNSRKVTATYILNDYNYKENRNFYNVNLDFMTYNLKSKINKSLSHHLNDDYQIIDGIDIENAVDSEGNYTVKFVVKFILNDSDFRKSLKVVIDFENYGILDSITGERIKSSIPSITLYSAREILVPIYTENGEIKEREYFWSTDSDFKDSYIVEIPGSLPEIGDTLSYKFMYADIENGEVKYRESFQVYKTYQGKDISIDKSDIKLVAGHYDYNGNSYTFYYKKGIPDTESPKITEISGPYKANLEYNELDENVSEIKHKDYLRYKITISDNMSSNFVFDYGALNSNIFDDANDYIRYVKITQNKVSDFGNIHVINVYFVCEENCKYIENEITTNILVENLSNAIKDKAGNLSVVQENANKTSQFTIVPSSLLFVESSVKGTVYYRKDSGITDFETTLRFTRKIESSTMKINVAGESYDCSIDAEGKLVCSVNLVNLIENDNSYEVTFSGTVKDIYGNSMSFSNDYLGNITICIDNTPIIITFNEKENVEYYKGVTDKLLEFEISELGAKLIENYKDLIVVSIVNLEDEETSVATCNVSVGEIELNKLKIIINNCISNVETEENYSGNIKITLGKILEDKAGNLNDEMSFIVNYIDVNNSDGDFEYEISVEGDVKISANGTKTETKLVLSFENDFVLLCSECIEIGNNVNAIITNVKQSYKNLVISLQATDELTKIDGYIKILIKEATLIDNYGNYNKDIEIENTSINVLNAPYESIFTVSPNTDYCILDNASSVYYCRNSSDNNKAEIVIEGVIDNSIDRRIINGKAVLYYYIGSGSLESIETTPVYTEVDNGEIITVTFNVQLNEFHNGVFKISSIELCEDEVGNKGVYSIENYNVVVDTTIPDFNNKNETYTVSIGDFYKEYEIKNMYQADSEAVYSIQGIYDSSKETKVESTVLYNGNVYKKKGTYYVKITAVDKAGNENSTFISLNVGGSLIALVTFNDKDAIYGDLYTFVKEDIISVSRKDSGKLDNLDIDVNDIKSAITSTTIDKETLNGQGFLDAGKYSISHDPILIVEGIEIELVVTPGVYTVNKYKLSVFDHCTYIAPSKVYDGDVYYKETLLMTCTGIGDDSINLTYNRIEFNSTDVKDNVTYTIYGLEVGYDYSNNYEINITDITKHDGKIIPAEIDLSEVTLTSKIYDGTNAVLNYSYHYSSNVEIRWTSVEFGEPIGEGIYKVNLHGAVTSNSNYTLKYDNGLVVARGEIISDNEAPVVEYNYNNKKIDETGKVITTVSTNDVSTFIEIVSVKDNTIDENKNAVINYNWYECDETLSSCESSLVVPNNQLVVFTGTETEAVKYIKVEVTDASNNSDVRYFVVDLNTSKLKISSISVDEEHTTAIKEEIDSKVQYTAYKTKYIVLNVAFNKLADFSKVLELKIVLSGDNNNIYEFICSEGADDSTLYCGYFVNPDEKADKNLKVVDVIGFDKIKDVYGNSFEKEIYEAMLNEKVNIDVSNGSLTNINYVVKDVDNLNKIDNVYYIKGSELKGKTIEVTLTFDDEIKDEEVLVENISLAELNKQLECVVSSTNTITCTLEVIDEVTYDGLLMINLDQPLVIPLENKGSVEIDNEVLSGLLSKEFNSQTILGTQVYIDNSELEVIFSLEKGIVYKIGKVNVSFNKNVTTEFTLDDFVITINGEVITDEQKANIAKLEYADGYLIIEYIGETKDIITFNFVLKEKSIITNIGTETVEGADFDLVFDNSELVINDEKVNVNLIGNKKENILGIGGKAQVTIGFNKDIVSLGEEGFIELTYSIGSNEFTTNEVQILDGKLVFTIEVKTSGFDNEFLTIEELKYEKLKDVFDKEWSGSDASITIREIKVDTKDPEIELLDVSAPACKEVEGKYYCNGAQTINITIEFDENITKIDGLLVVANVEILEKNTIVTNNKVEILLTLGDLKNSESITVTRLYAKVYDELNNEFTVDVDNISTDSIKFDTSSDINFLDLNLDNYVKSNPTYINGIVYRDTGVAPIVSIKYNTNNSGAYEELVYTEISGEEGKIVAQLEKAIKVEKTKTFYLLLEDASGNKFYGNNINVMVDTEAPDMSVLLTDNGKKLPGKTISINEKNVTVYYSFNKTISITVNSNDSEAVCTVDGLDNCVIGSELELGLESLLVDNEAKVTVIVTDKAGNKTEQNIIVVYTEPSIEDNIKEWSNRFDVTINGLFYNEDVSYNPSYKITYKIIDSNNQSVLGTYEIIENITGVNSKQISPEYQDKVEGNVDFIVTIEISETGYSKTLESINLCLDKTIGFEVDPYVMNGTEWTNTTVTIVAEAKTELSGIKEVKLLNDNAEKTLVDNVNCELDEGTLEILCNESGDNYNLSNGNYIVEIIDNAGNKAQSKVEINNIDRVGYNLMTEIRENGANANDYVKGYEVDIVVSGDKASIKYFKYVLVEDSENVTVTKDNFDSVYNDAKTNGGFFGEATKSVYGLIINNRSGNYKMYAKVEDVAGNVTFIGSVLMMLDNEAPSIEIVENISEEYKHYKEEDIKNLVSAVSDSKSSLGKEILMTLELVDEFGNVMYSDLSVLDGSNTKNGLERGIVEGEYYLRVTAIDALENVRVVTSKVIRIDNVGLEISRTNGEVKNEAPRYEISEFEKDVTTVSYCVGAIGSSGKVEQKCQENITDKEFSINVETDETVTNKYVEITIVDKYGNISVYTENFVYDNKAPIITFALNYYIKGSVEAKPVEANHIFEEEIEENGIKIVKYSTDMKINDYFEVSFDISDNVGGICYNVYQKDSIVSMSQSGCTALSSSDTALKNIQIHEGKYINVYAIDGSGNESRVVLIIDSKNIDKVGVKPSIPSIDKALSTSKDMTISFNNRLNDAESVTLYRADELLSGEDSKKMIERVKSLNVNKDIISLWPKPNGVSCETDENGTICSIEGNKVLYRVNESEIVVNVIENGVYVVEVKDIYGNVNYNRIEINNIDRDAPVLKDSKITGGNYKVVVKKGASYNLVDNTSGETVSNDSISEFSYNNKIYLRLEIGSLEDQIVKEGNRQYVYLYIKDDVKGEQVGYKKIELDSEGLNRYNETIELNLKNSGYVVYYLVDEAGNTSVEQKIKVNLLTENNINVTAKILDSNINQETVVNSESYYNKADVKFEVSDSSMFGALTYYLVKAGTTTGRRNVATIESISNLNTRIELTDIDNIDDIYELYYEITDKLGNKKTVRTELSINIDTKEPVNKYEYISFRLKKLIPTSGDPYYVLIPTISENITNDYTNINILYPDGSEYCVIEVGKDAMCGVIDQDKYIGSEGKYTFQTQLIDKAGNKSNVVSGYEEKYDESRNFSLSVNYNGSSEKESKKINLMIDIDNPYNSVKVIKVYEVKDSGDVEIHSKTNPTLVRGVYTVELIEVYKQREEYLTKLELIEKTFRVEVFDNYQQDVEGYQQGQMPSANPNISIIYDIRTPDVWLTETTTLITTKETENSFDMRSDKELSEALYIFERKTGTNYSQIQSTTAFNSLYSICAADSKCVSGKIELAENLKEGIFAIVDPTNKLLSGNYRIIILAKDKDGHEIIKQVISDIRVDNEAPDISLSLEGRVEEGVYSKSVEISVIENNSSKYGSSLAYMYIIDLVAKAKIVDDKFELNGKSYIISELDVKNNMFELESNKYRIDGDNVLLVHVVTNATNASSVTIKIGNGTTSGIYDGRYRIEVKDKFDYISTKEVEIDSENEGFSLGLLDGSTGITKYNKETLNKVTITLMGNMKTLKVTFMNKISNEQLRIVLDRVTNKYSLIEGLNEPIIKELKLGMLDKGSKINLSELMGYGNKSVYDLNYDITVMRIEVVNVSSLLEYDEYSLDFENPVITVDNGAMYNNKKFIKIDKRDCNNKENCYKLDLSVIVGDSDETTALINIVGAFKPTADKLNYTATKDSGRLKVVFSQGVLNAKDGKGSWSNYSSILRTVGEYLLEFQYEDEAHNKAKPVYLVINVIDEKDPTFIPSITGKVSLSIKDDNGVKYTDKLATLDAVGRDNYGFIVNDILSDETKEYSLKYTFKGKDVEFDKDGKVYYEDKLAILKVGNEYTIYKDGEFKLIYQIIDSVGRIAEKSVIITVIDEYAPVINEGNNIPDGEYYKVDINNKELCFETGKAGCLDPLSAFDKEDGISKEVKILKVEYKSLSGSRYEVKEEGSNYIIERITDESSMFKIKKLRFDDTGYYRITFEAMDSSTNKVNLSYVIKVYDSEAPEFIVEGNKVASGEVVDLDRNYDENFKKELLETEGKNEDAKIINIIRKWLQNKENVTVEHNYEDLNGVTIKSIERIKDEQLLDKEYARFKAILTSKDASGNTSEITIIFHIKDTNNPINGKIEFSYDKSKVIETNGVNEIVTNANNLYFKLSGASDITNIVKYEYKVVINGVEQNSEWQVAEANKYILAHMALTNDEMTTVQVKYRVKDSVGNVSEEQGKVSEKYIFDKKAPEIVIVDEENNEVEGIYDLGLSLKVIFKDDGNKITVVGYKNNQNIETLHMITTNGQSILINEFGHYKYQITDAAGNTAEKEIVIIEKTNTYTMIDRNSLNNVEGANEVEIIFDKVVLQELNSTKDYFSYPDLSEIGNKDLIYLMGIVPNKEGRIFLITQTPIEGSVFKQKPTFELYASTNITGIDPNYSIDDYLLNYNNKSHILIGIVKNAVEETQPQKPVKKEENKESGGNSTWVLFLLGTVGVLGGGFLVLKLRKRVRAA